MFPQASPTSASGEDHGDWFALTQFIPGVGKVLPFGDFVAQRGHGVEATSLFIIGRNRSSQKAKEGEGEE